MLDIKIFKNIPQHLKVTMISWLSRGIYILASLYSIKIATKLLGVEEFAIYAILTNIVTWLLLCDIGLGYSMQNYISEFRVKNKDFKEIIFLGLSTCFAVGTVLIIALYFTNDYLVKLLFQHIDQQKSSIIIVQKAFFYASFCGILTGVGLVSHKILYARQQGFWPNILLSVAQIITLTALLLLKNDYFKYDLLTISLVFFLPNVLLSFVPSLYYYFNSIKHILKQDIKTSYHILLLKKIIQRGSSFFIFTVTSCLVLQIDYIVMSQTVPSEQIVTYNILFKIYNAFFLVYSTLLFALWPTIAEWYTEKKISLIYDHCKKYIVAGILFIITVSVAFMWQKEFVLSMISDIKLTISGTLVLLFTIYFCLRVWTDTFAIILQSTSKVKSLWIFTPIQAVISFCLQIYLSKKFGINGILMALIISFLLTVVWGLPYQVKKILGQRI